MTSSSGSVNALEEDQFIDPMSLIQSRVSQEDRSETNEEITDDLLRVVITLSVEEQIKEHNSLIHIGSDTEEDEFDLTQLRANDNGSNTIEIFRSIRSKYYERLEAGEFGGPDEEPDEEPSEGEINDDDDDDDNDDDDEEADEDLNNDKEYRQLSRLG
ncbi:nonsense-mediated mRNA decay protein 2-like [Macadamia integrifolia]|uniref:nonsense-mediated mRNA decay protein 2-like n=1 Tax=Macadamia integrifolia TaxID=60698 RepID=UPI001C50117B|nr:nonsense-mediated mRNA decay protein 2-like [Macadamia integrifolia]